MSEKIDGQLTFTEEAISELKELEKTLIEMLDYTVICLKEPNPKVIEKNGRIRK